MRYFLPFLLLISSVFATPRVVFNLYNKGDSPATVYLQSGGLAVSGGGIIQAKSFGQFIADSSQCTDGVAVEAWMMNPGLVRNGASFVLQVGSGDPILLATGYPPPGDGYTQVDAEFAPVGGLLADDKKTLWQLGGTELNAQVYREGVDKLMDAVKSGSGSGGTGDLSATNSKLDQIKAAVEAGPQLSSADKTAEQTGNQIELENAVNNSSTGAAASLAAAFPVVSSVGSITAAGSSSSVSLGTFSALGSDFNLVVFGSFWDGFLSYANWIREILLWGAVFYFAKYSRDQLEKYLAITLLAPQLTTKVAPGQVLVPGIGLAKQIGVATGYVVAVVAVVALTVGLINTGLGSMITGTSITNFASAGGSAFNSVLSASGPIGAAYSVVSEFVPVAGMIQLFFLEISFSWALPSIWAAAYMYAKVVHP